MNIRKATLRSWRTQFAENLRQLGVAANATERAVRGETTTRKSDGIFRAAQRGDFTHVNERKLRTIRELSLGQISVERGRASLQKTRAEIVEGLIFSATKIWL